MIRMAPLKIGAARHTLTIPDRANCPRPNSMTKRGRPTTVIKMTYAINASPWIQIHNQTKEDELYLHIINQVWLGHMDEMAELM